MNTNGMNEEFSKYSQSASVETAVRKTMVGVYGWMTLALLISAATGLYLASNINLLVALASTSLYWVLVIAEFAVVLTLSARAHKMSSAAAKFWFVVYAVLNGVTFGTVFAIYDIGTVGYAFMVTASVFGVMTVYGYVTKTDLSSIGNLFVMALFGLVIATFLNFFIRSDAWTLGLMYVGVIIFIGLIGYDTQKIKSYAVDSQGNAVKNAGIIGALTLYLDFINIFLSLVRIMGRDN